jgi:hypothetical protein
MSDVIRKIKNIIKGGNHACPTFRCLYATYRAGNNRIVKTMRAVADRPMHAVVGGLGGCELEVDMVKAL